MNFLITGRKERKKKEIRARGTEKSTQNSGKIGCENPKKKGEGREEKEEDQNQYGQSLTRLGCSKRLAGKTILGGGIRRGSENTSRSNLLLIEVKGITGTTRHMGNVLK